MKPMLWKRLVSHVLEARPAASRRPRRLVLERLGERTPFDASGWAEGLQPEGEAGPVVPDFTLVDVNPNSPTFNQGISPRRYLEQVTGWYFTHST